MFHNKPCITYNIIIPGIPKIPVTPTVNPFIPMAMVGRIKFTTPIVAIPIIILIIIVSNCLFQRLQKSITTHTAINPIITCSELTVPTLDYPLPYYMYAR